MKWLLFIGFFFCLDIDVLQVRSLFDEAVEDEDKANELVSLTGQHLSENVLWLGYNGVGRIMLAKHAFSPISKWNYFNKGKKDIEKAIALAPENVELRFLRLTIQQNAPGILNYSDKIESDRNFLRVRVGALTDKDLQSRINKYLTRKGNK